MDIEFHDILLRAGGINISLQRIVRFFDSDSLWGLHSPYHILYPIEQLLDDKQRHQYLMD